jgi:dipeptidyl-peptidase 4
LFSGGILLTRASVYRPFAAPAFFAIFLPLSALPLAAQAPEKPLTVEGIFAHGPVLGEAPDELAWSPDNKHLTYLEGGELMDVDPATGNTHVLVSAAKMSQLAADNSSERDRDHRARYNMASYLWAPDSTHLLFDSNGRLWYYDLHNGTGVQIGFSGLLSGDDPKFSPDGSAITFVRDRGLSIVRLREQGSPSTALAPAPNPSGANGPEVLNGQVDWVYLEELDVRSNYFWSPDSKNVAYMQMVETQVPQYPITDWIPSHATVDWQRYPQPGDPNPEVHIAVVSEKGGRATFIRLQLNPGDYVPRFGWVDHKTLWIETLSRDHKHRTIFFADADQGDTRQMLQISDEKYLPEAYDVSVGDGAIVLTSWSDGHNHLYLYNYDSAHPMAAAAQLKRQLTSGDFDVGDVYNVDTVKKAVDYASNEGNPLEQQTWQVNFAGERRQLSAGVGSHEATFSPDGGAFSDKFSALMQPPAVRVCSTPVGANSPVPAYKCHNLWETHVLDSYHLHAPEMLQVPAHDGTTLYATLLLPVGATTAASVPLIVNPYGGPGAQMVANDWKDSFLFDELLAQHGFAVLRADNRGMAKRGRAFEQAAYHNFGPVQLEDQLTVIDAALAKYPQLDAKRLGWWGGSWGGHFTLYALTHSDRFRAGVALVSVTDWRDYDSVYTERYLGLPSEDPDGYRDFSVVNSAANLKGHLLLVAGTGDDNVHMENTVQFLQKLIEAHIPYDLQIYPRKMHSLTGREVRTHLYTRILDEFETYLKPPVQ